MMLAGPRDYLFAYQWAPVVAFLAFWLGAGPYFVSRALARTDLPLSRRRMGRCAQINFLANLAGLIAMGIVGMFSLVLATKVGPRGLVLIGVVGGPLAMLGMAWAIAAMMLDADGKEIRKLVLRGIGPVLLACLVAGAIAAIPAMHLRGKEVLRGRCRARLMAIQEACREYTRNHPMTFAESLEELVKEGDLDADKVYCPARGAQEPGYLYVPCRTDLLRRSKDKIRACDRRGNHGEAGRIVLFSDGRPGLLSEEAFQKLLTQPNNAGIAAQDKADQ